MDETSLPANFLAIDLTSSWLIPVTLSTLFKSYCHKDFFNSSISPQEADMNS